MSIEEVNKVDIIGTDKKSGNIILTISDHLDWDSDIYHEEVLQEKLNGYISFIESGEIYNEYPESKDRKIIIKIVSKYQYPKRGLDFLEKVTPILSSIGVGLEYELAAWD